MFTLEEMKRIRRDFGLTYNDIHKGCKNVSISTIQKAFGGFAGNPRNDTLERLSIYFEKFVKDHASEMWDKMPRKVIYEPDEKNLFVAENGEYFTRDNLAFKVPYEKIFDRGGYTYDEYTKLELPEGMRVEVIDGYLYTMDAPNIRHQDIVMYICNVIFQFIRKNKEKCRAMVSPVDVRLEYDKGDRTVVQPDILIVCDRGLVKDGKSVAGAPDFTLEVVSRHSRLKDMNVKMEKYRNSGVREYWIVDYYDNKIFKYDFAESDIPKVYTFADKVPMKIYDEKLIIDFVELKDYLEW